MSGHSRSSSRIPGGSVVHVSSGRVTVYSRPGRNMTESVPQLGRLVDAVPFGTVLDGEIVAGSGRSWSFYRLSPQLATTRAAVGFAAFDLLALADTSLLSAPYEERRRALGDLDFLGPAWCTVPAWSDVEPPTFWPPASQGLEGLVAKRLGSRYRPALRSPDWVKVKTASWRTTHASLRARRGR